MADNPYRAGGAPPTMAIRCLYCGGVRPSAEAACATCGDAQACDATPASAADRLHCPRCRTVLAAINVDSTLVFQCPSCLGCFVSVHAWSVILQRVSEGQPPPLPGFVPLPPGRELPAERLMAEVSCSRCGRPTDRATFGVRSGVVVDICAMHGIWFDAAEITRALDFARSVEQNEGRIPVSEDELREDLAHERHNEERRLRARAAEARDLRELQLRRMVRDEPHVDLAHVFSWLWR